ncbi:hypothetical protein C0Q70_12857 [Pomacea canaliculata]|uniref:Ig-like domain-containing protein n=1 Tax=Pomacea canaliculata TaxID=400727 RepID=A0A2T7P2N9_POMCA|nr:hypothetical protein C0Q70_12857 [Pomacea canaliculata]
MTLKCHATDVYPSPVYTWDNIHCDSTNKNDVCTFSPKGERDNGKEVVCTVTNGLTVREAQNQETPEHPYSSVKANDLLSDDITLEHNLPLFPRMESAYGDVTIRSLDLTMND